MTATTSYSPLPIHAPSYHVPNAEIVAIEHPYVINNVDRGIQSLGGIQKLTSLLNDADDRQPQASLYQRPGDRRSKPLRSQNESTHNLVLMITVPRRRKATPESQSYEQCALKQPSEKARSDTERIAYHFRSLADDQGNCKIKVVGRTKQTHRFRSLPDFTKSSSESPFIQKMNETILPFDYQKIKNFKLDMSKGAKPNTDIIPPPKWSKLDIPFNFAYRQNPGVSTARNIQGEIVTRNQQVVPKLYSQLLSYDAPTIPDGPSPELASIDSLDPTIRNLVLAAQRVVNERPILTRRCLLNLIPSHQRHVGQSIIKLIFQYVGYFFASGPWRDALVRFGIDPRTDPQYRIYQTLTFMVEPDGIRSRSKRLGQTKREITEQESRRESHIFDGTQLCKDGKVWQVCDVADPVLSEVFSTQNLRETCHMTVDGWYHNGTMAKGKGIMRKKITALISGVDEFSNLQYIRIAASIPDVLSRSDNQVTGFALEDALPEEKALVSSIRTAAYQGQRHDNSKAVDEPDETEAQTDGEGRLSEAEQGLSDVDGISSGGEEMLDDSPASP